MSMYFTGNVIVTDFGDETGTISNIQKDKLTDVFDKWLSSDLAKSLNCHCSEFSCLDQMFLLKICTIRIWILKIMSVICTNNHKLYNFKTLIMRRSTLSISSLRILMLLQIKTINCWQ